MNGQRDFGVPLATPRRVRYTLRARRSRRAVAAGLLFGLAVTAAYTQRPPALDPLVTGCILGVYAVLAIGVWLVHEASLFETYRLLRDGKAVVGTVIERQPGVLPQDSAAYSSVPQPDPKAPVSWEIRYVFTYEDGTMGAESVAVSQEFLDRWVIGDAILLLTDAARGVVMPYGLIRHVELA